MCNEFELMWRKKEEGNTTEINYKLTNCKIKLAKYVQICSV